MSKKKILIAILILIISIVGVVGYIVFSFTSSNAYIDTTRLTENITSDGDLLNPTYSGNILLEQDIFIYNSGDLNIENLIADIQVFFSGSIDPAEVEIGSGVNELGTIEAGENVSRTLTIVLTNFIPRLAVEDGTLRIFIDISFKIQYVDYQIEIPTKETTESWNAPFGV